MAETPRHFVPAAGRDWLLPFYDPLSRLFGSEAALRRLLERVELSPGERVLDLGCGTGALSLQAKRAQPLSEIVGLDPDAKALARARRKAERGGLAVEFQQGYGDALPFAEASFDCVLSSFMFHHLESTQKPAVLREVWRVLRPGGWLHLLDFGDAGHGPGSFLARLLHREESLRANTADGLAELMRQAGFANAAEAERRRSHFGGLIYYRAQRPRGLRGDAPQSGGPL